MKAFEIWEQVTGRYYELRLENGSLILEATDFSRELPPGLITELKDHKPELLTLLHFQEQADALLLESTRRIAQAWPRGYDLDVDWEWRKVDRDLHRAYFSSDTSQVKAVLERRELLALKLFDSYRKQRAA